ncbi:hypothetical protein ACFZCP_00755 [Streptomyces sp. NPDC007971]|uniref:hypothetical protein n=1 Tax=Streptomyces sp. NPDC007971 TaxID=3364799 RepID=UPI0036ED523F
MGERHSGDGPSGRRRGHPGGTVLGPGPAGADAPGFDDAAFGARFAAALRAGAVRDGFPDGVDAVAERRAVAAFRAARDSGAHRARTRRRADWRPRAQRRARLSVRATFSVFLASVTLGGVAFAAIDSAGPAAHRDGDARRPQPAASSPQRPAARPHDTASGASSARPHHPAAAKDTLAHCRAYEQVRGRGKALDATAWQRLVAAAGGEKNVTAYCAARSTPAGGRKTSKPAEPNDVGRTAKEPKTSKGDKTDRSGRNGKGGATASPKPGGKN